MSLPLLASCFIGCGNPSIDLSLDPYELCVENNVAFCSTGIKLSSEYDEVM
jgi:hypothetical protein